MGNRQHDAQAEDELSPDDLEAVSGGVSAPTSLEAEGVQAGVRVKVKFPVVSEE